MIDTTWEVVPPEIPPTLDQAREMGRVSRAIGAGCDTLPGIFGKGVDWEPVRRAFLHGWEAEDGRIDREREAGDKSKAARCEQIWRAVVATADATGQQAVKAPLPPGTVEFVDSCGQLWRKLPGGTWGAVN